MQNLEALGFEKTGTFTGHRLIRLRSVNGALYRKQVGDEVRQALTQATGASNFREANERSCRCVVALDNEKNVKAIAVILPHESMALVTTFA